MHRVLIASRNSQARQLIREYRDDYPFVIQIATSDDDLADARERARCPGISRKTFVAGVIDCSLSTAVESIKDMRVMYPTIPIICVWDIENLRMRIIAASAGASAIIFQRNWPVQLFQHSNRGCLLEGLVKCHLELYPQEAL